MENHPWNSTENFEQTKPFIYLDTASRSALPIRIAEIGVHALKKKVSPWHGIGSDSDVSEVRSLYAQLINAPSGSSIAIAHSTSIAISIAAKNVADSGRLNSGSSVLLIEKEMASAVYAWQDACLKTGSRLKIVTENANTLSWTDTIIANIDKAVVVIALPHCHWCDGSFIDLERISQYLDDCTFFKTRPYLIIDGTQSIGAMPFDVKRIKPSFVACSVHKWLNAPYGMSLIYLDPSFHDIWQPIDHHERARLGSDKCEWDEEGAMDNIRGYPIDFMSGARRIDSGGRPNPILIPMVKEALKMIILWEPCRIQAYITTLTDQLARSINTKCPLLSVKQKNHRCGHIIGVKFKDDSLNNSAISLLGIALKERQVILSVRSGCVRVAPYIYNSSDEINVVANLFRVLSNQIYSQMASTLKELQFGNILLNNNDMSTTDAAVIIKKRVYSNDVNENDKNDCSGFDISDIQNTTSTEQHIGMVVNESRGTEIAINANLKEGKYRVLVTGSTGWLGQQVCEMILQEYSLLDSIDLYAGYHTSEPFWVSPDKRILLDLSDKNNIEKVIENIMPDMIIHLAAITSPGLCEKNPIEAYEINSPVKFIEIVQIYVPNCLFIFTSTDLIYDGESAPYSILNNNRPSERGSLIQQEDKVMHDERPETIYGKTKLLFEKSVLTLRNGVVLRLSNMLGKPYAYRLNGVKFMHFLYDSYKSKAFIGLRYDEKRSFVFVNDVLKIIAKFIDHGLLNSCANKRFLPRTLTREDDDIKNVITMPIEPSLRIFNIGGPVGISRLHLASLLAEVLNNNLELVDFSTNLPLSPSVNPLISNYYKKNNDKSDTKIHIDTHSTTKLKIDNEINLIKWSVHATSNQESIKESGVLNPRDVTMNVDYTETFFDMKLTPPRDTIKFLISYFEI